MSKIICELCGTMYPDTEDFCPTCGTEKPETAEFTTSATEEQASQRSYTPTKGGRFSDANVRKRLSSQPAAPVPARAPRRPEPRQERPQRPEPRSERPQRPEPRPERPRQAPDRPRQEQSRRPQQPRKQEKSNTGLIITAVILLLAIIGMLLYIYFNFFAIVFLKNT